jgi:AraC-like DNA-binding protein
MEQVKPHFPPTAAGGVARLAVARLIADDVDPGPLLHATSIPLAQIADTRSRISAAGQVKLLTLASQALDDDLLGFRLAEHCDLRQAGLVYFVLTSSATFGDALARAGRYCSINNESIVIELLHGPELRIRHRYVGVPRHKDRHHMEFWLTVLVRICQRFTDNAALPIRISFVHPRCAASSELEAFFGREISFGAEQDEIAFARGVSSLLVRNADPYLNELLVHYCEMALSQRASAAGPLRTRVENAIVPLLPHGTARMDVVAKVLGLNRRTLGRHLAAEGVTFSNVLEEMRRELALQYLQDATLSASRIAWILGFQESSAFTHAFKRWTGQTPSRMRQQYLADSDVPADAA